MLNSDASSGAETPARLNVRQARDLQAVRPKHSQVLGQAHARPRAFVWIRKIIRYCVHEAV